MSVSKDFRRNGIKKRIRKVVFGDANAPRLSVFRSTKQISAQLIDGV
ncbi:MAG: 50S ribosomal protein L18, partial [Bacteroidia bacterium]|nr:50S ribosomal protein L18 [Bacteroidia bacterium]